MYLEDDHERPGQGSQDAVKDSHREGVVGRVLRVGPPRPPPAPAGGGAGDECALLGGPRGPTGAVPGRARNPRLAAEVRAALGPGARRPQWPHHGLEPRRVRT